MISQKELKQQKEYGQLYYCPKCGRRAAEYYPQSIRRRGFIKIVCNNCRFEFYLSD